MSLHLVFPDKVANFMPFAFEFLQPANFFEKNFGAKRHFQTAFLNDVSSNLTADDTLIWFIDCAGEDSVEKLAKCKARKFLRAVDPSKSDRILYKNQLALHDKVNFEGFAICYPNKEHINFLESKNLKIITWPHSLDFKNSPETFKKESGYICAGQQHKEYYPDRWRLTEILCKRLPTSGIYLPHPGFESDKLAHPYVGEKFLELLSKFCVMPVGIGINDGLHMKFVEAAYAGVLPLGLAPSYLPDEIVNCIPFSRLDPTDYVEEEIADQISELFNNQQELINRITKYRNYFKQEYDLTVVLNKVAKEIFR